MLKIYVPKPNLSKLKIVRQKNENKPELPIPFRLSILTQFYPPDYAATGQLIEELAIHLGRLGIDVQVLQDSLGTRSKKPRLHIWSVQTKY